MFHQRCCDILRNRDRNFHIITFYDWKRDRRQNFLMYPFTCALSEKVKNVTFFLKERREMCTWEIFVSHLWKFDIPKIWHTGVKYKKWHIANSWIPLVRKILRPQIFFWKNVFLFFPIQPRGMGGWEMRCSFFTFLKIQFFAIC